MRLLRPPALVCPQPFERHQRVVFWQSTTQILLFEIITEARSMPIHLRLG